ncbi:MAG: C45 family peptidase, partial [Myxococcales bacterium]|nr:C45 family peptidase [Myxococcales bacterium]
VATLPDTMVWLANRVVGLTGRGPAVRHRLALGLGCTSAVAWGAATSDGALMHARNFDYHGVDCWPKTAAVLFHEPDEGQRYVAFGAAGVPLGGITAMNEAGLTLTVHQHMFTDQATLGGTPIGIVGDEVMRHARDLGDAERILGAHRPIGCWTYVITDGKSREVLCWEENPHRRIALRPEPGATTFGYSNIYIDPELGATEADHYPSYWRNNERRFRRAGALLEERSGALTPQAMAEILADRGGRGEEGCRISDSISMVMTVGSIVFEPAKGRMWVGTGEAPTSDGRFLPFELEGERQVEELAPLDVQVDTLDAQRAFASFREAFVAYVDREDPSEARRLLDLASGLAPRESIYRFGAGLVSLDAGDLPAAAAALDEALALGHPDLERISSFHLWRGRVADLRGQREEAKRHYRLSLGRRGDDPVRKAARRGLRRPYTERRRRALQIEMAFIDVIEP